MLTLAVYFEKSFQPSSIISLLTIIVVFGMSDNILCMNREDFVAIESGVHCGEEYGRAFACPCELIPHKDPSTWWHFMDHASRDAIKTSRANNNELAEIVL